MQQTISSLSIRMALAKVRFLVTSTYDSVSGPTSRTCMTNKASANLPQSGRTRNRRSPRSHRYRNDIRTCPYRLLGHRFINVCIPCQAGSKPFRATHSTDKAGEILYHYRPTEPLTSWGRSMAALMRLTTSLLAGEHGHDMKLMRQCV